MRFSTLCFVSVGSSLIASETPGPPGWRTSTTILGTELDKPRTRTSGRSMKPRVSISAAAPRALLRHAVDAIARLCAREPRKKRMSHPLLQNSAHDSTVSGVCFVRPPGPRSFLHLTACRRYLLAIVRPGTLSPRRLSSCAGTDPVRSRALYPPPTQLTTRSRRPRRASAHARRSAAARRTRGGGTRAKSSDHACRLPHDLAHPSSAPPPQQHLYLISKAIHQ